MFIEYQSSPILLRVLALGAAIFTAGSSFLWPLITIYVREFLGQSLTVAGIVLLIHQAAALLGNLIGGYLFDRWGGSRTIISGVILAIFTVLGIGLTSNFYLYAILLTFFGLFSGIIFPSLIALANYIWPEGGRKAVNLIYVAQNLGVAIGSALGGWVASYSFQWAFFSNALIYLIFLFILYFIHKENISIKPSLPTQSGLKLDRKRVTDYRIYFSLGLLCLAMIAIYIPYVQWSTTIPIYLQLLDIPISSYSLLWTLNGSLIVLLQPVLHWFIYRFRPNLKQQIVIGTAIFTLSFCVVAFSTQFYGFIIAMMIMTIGEMIAWPAVPALAAELASENLKGQFQGIISGAASFGKMTGPLLGGILFEVYNARWLFFMIVLCLASILCFFHYDRFLKKNLSISVNLRGKKSL